MVRQNPASAIINNTLIGLAILAGLYAASLYNYILFHNIAEIFGIVIASGIFIIAWNSRHIVRNNYLLFMGIAYLFIGIMGLLHALSYKGMEVFHGYGPNLPTQLWIASRYVESISLFIAPLVLGRRIRTGPVLLLFSMVTILLLGSIFLGIFPVCFIEGEGLTPFKKTSEYVISMILAASVFTLSREKEKFDPLVYRLLAAAIMISIIAELAFTFYADVYGFFNLTGHFLKIISIYLLYKAIIENSLMKPYESLFRDLKLNEEALLIKNNAIESSINATLLTDAGSVVTYVNPAFLKLWGYDDREEVMGRSISEIWQDAETAGTIMDKLHSSGSWSGELSAIKKDRTFFDVQISASSVKDNSGRIVCIIASFIDITNRKRIENMLRESESRYRSLFVDSPISIWEEDYSGIKKYIDGMRDSGVTDIRKYFMDRPDAVLHCISTIKVLSVNRAAQELFGAGSSEEFINGFGNIFTPASCPVFSEMLVALAEGRTDFESESAARTLRGGIIYISMKISIPAGHENSWDRVIASVVDITKRRRAEEEQRYLQKRLEAQWKIARMVDTDDKTLTGHVLNEIISITGSEYGFYGFMNEQEDVFSVHSWSKKAMDGCNIREKTLLFPIGRSGIWADSIRERKAIIINDYPGERHPLKKGLPEGHVPIKRILAVPVFMNDRIVALGAVANKAVDYNEKDIEQMEAFLQGAQIIQDKRRAEEELNIHREHLMELVEERTYELQRSYEKLENETIERRHAEEQIRLMALFAELSPFPFLRFDINGKVLMANAAAVETFDFDPDSGESLRSILPGIDDIDLTACIREGTILSLAAEINSRFFQFTLIGVPELNVGQLYGSDITDQKKAEAETLRTKHLASLGELAAGVAHEINNPINGIINYSQILANKSAPESKENEIARRIIREGDRIAGIIRSLLSFARDIRDEKHFVHIQEIMSESLALTEAQLKMDGIGLKMDIPPDLPGIMAQPQQLEQVFLNLISNSRYALNQKYPGINNNKVLKITGRKTELDGSPQIQLSFYDSGTGIPEKTMDKIMNPFFTTKPSNVGTGLGLSISHGIIDNHKGAITVRSVEGEFTEVIITLPAYNGRTEQ